MNYCNELNSLSVLSLFEGELLGKVEKLYFDDKMKKLVELEIKSDEGIVFALQTKNIYHIGKNAITIKNNQQLTLKTDETNLALSPIGSKCFSINGEFLGVISDISLNKKFEVDKYFFDTGISIDSRLLASHGKTTVIFFDETSKCNIKKMKPETSPSVYKTNTKIEAQILPEPEQKTEIPQPKPTIQNSDFLLGRVCTKDIFNFNNELLIKAHAVVNKKNLKEISKFGKLKELMIYSK